MGSSPSKPSFKPARRRILGRRASEKNVAKEWLPQQVKELGKPEGQGSTASQPRLAGMGTSSQPSSKPACWRIRGIRASEKAAVRKWLQQQVKELGKPEGQGSSLARDGERTLCATLTSHKRPVPPGNCHWEVEEHFIGSTPVSDPEDAEVDIVVVTGLGGHALGSFRSSDGASIWLRDFAPEDLPKARFITYGYNTTVAASESNQGIRELAQTLLNNLTDLRHCTQTQQRPLIFVCHSLGGVVVKEALVQSSKATEQEHRRINQLMLSTCGLVMMGVPNLGLRHIQLEAIVEGQPNADFINDLEVKSDNEPSQFLKALARDFSRLDKTRQPPFKIVSYYETQKSPTMSVHKGILEMKGPKEFMVTQASAGHVGHTIRDLEHIPSPTDHRGLVRFDFPHDDRYISLIGNLKRMAAEASTARPTFNPGHEDGQRLAHPARQNVFKDHRARRYVSKDLLFDMPSSFEQKPGPFVKRTKFLDEMRSLMLSESSSFNKTIVALYGAPGSGKTEVANNFVREYRAEFSACLKFDASGKEILGRCLEKLYSRISNTTGVRHAHSNLSRPHANPETLFEAVVTWLSRADNKSWIIVVDDIDTAMLRSDNSLIGRLLDRVPHGTFILISHSNEVRNFWMGTIPLPVGPFLPKESTSIFKQSLGRDHSRETEVDWHALSELLDYHPQAVDCAADYMKHERISSREFIKLWQACDEKIFRYGDSSRNKLSLSQTMSKAFEELDNSTKELLRISAHLDPSCIWLELFEQYATSRESSPSGMVVADAVEQIKAFSLSVLPRKHGVREDYDAIAIHPIMHKVMRISFRHLRKQDRDKHFNAALSMINHAAGPRQSKDYSRNLERILPHATQCYEDFAKDCSIVDGARFDHLVKLAKLMHGLGRPQEAEFLLVKLSKVLKEMPQPRPGSADSMQYCDALTFIGTIQHEHGYFDHAIQYYEKVLKYEMIVRETTGRLTVAEVCMYHNLGNAFKDKGDYENASQQLQLCRQGLRSLTHSRESKVLGLQLRQSQGMLSCEMGNFDEAETEVLKALDGFKMLYGSGTGTHMAICKSLHDLGVIEMRRNSLDAAADKFKETRAALYQLSDASTHIEPDLAWDEACLEEKRWRKELCSDEELKITFRRTLEQQEIALGFTHPKTIRTLAAYGDCLSQMEGHSQEAYNTLSTAYEHYRQSPRALSPAYRNEMYSCVGCLGEVCADLMKDEEALRHLTKALTSSEKGRGSKAYLYAACIARIHCRNNRLGEERVALQNVLKFRELPQGQRESLRLRLSVVERLLLRT